MSFGIDTRKLKRIIDLYQPYNQAQEMKYLLYLKGQDELYLNLQTCPFQGISIDSVEDRKSVFGINEFTTIKMALTKPFLESLAHPWIYIPLIMSFLIFLLEYLNITNEEGCKTIVLLVISISNWIVQSAEGFWFYLRTRKPVKRIENSFVTVIRESRRIEVPPEQVVVGDIVTLKTGDIVPADGWMIEGQEIQVIEQSTSGSLNRCKYNFRQSLNKLKQMKENIITTAKNELKCEISPVLIGGSQVKKGQVKMIVLCVGSTSRIGELLSHSHLNEHKNIFRAKLGKLVQSLYFFLVALQIIFAILLCAKIVYNASNTQWADMFSANSWKNMLAIPQAFIIGIPQGLHLGLMLGLWFLKSRIWYKNQIWISYCEDILKMANVNLICFDNSSDSNKVLYKQWWNEQTHKLDKQSLLVSKVTETESNQLQLPNNIDEEFKILFEQAYSFKDFKQPEQPYFPNDQYSLKNCAIESWNVADQLLGGKFVNYIVENGMIKYVLYRYKDHDKSSCFVLGQAQELLQQCTQKISEQQGQTNELTTQLIDQVQDAIQSAKKKFMSSLIIAFIDLPLQQSNIDQHINAIIKKNLTFLCLLGVNKFNDHNQYHLARNLKQIGIKMIVVTDCNLVQASVRARQAGLTTIEEKSIALSGDEFINLIGGIHCKECKKHMCTCTQRKGQYTIKNKEELTKIETTLDVIGNASPMHKVNLQIAMSQIDNFTAYLGAIPEDKPALSKCYLSISTDPCVQDHAAVCFPQNNFKLLVQLITWSRFSHQFVLKYIQLSLPALLVAVILLLIVALACNELILRLIPLTFTNVILCPLLTIGLTWQTPNPALMQIKQDNYSKSSKLITWSVKKQIVGQIIWQLLILFIVIFTGHLFIPQVQDRVDNFIGSDWAAKYSTSDKLFLASGLFINPIIDSNSFQQTYNHYHIYSRHLTIVYNIYTIMQIFNFINCRKITDKDINIIEGIEVQTIFILVLVFTIHILFMEFASSQVGFYPQSLTPQQWLICIGFAMTVFFISFIVKLLPPENHSSSSNKKRINKCAGLGVKLVSKREILSDFQIEDDIQFKEQ